jgi:hypothetical protein
MLWTPVYKVKYKKKVETFLWSSDIRQWMQIWSTILVHPFCENSKPHSSFQVRSSLLDGVESMQNLRCNPKPCVCVQCPLIWWKCHMEQSFSQLKLGFQICHRHSDCNCKIIFWISNWVWIRKCWNYL